MRRIAFVVFVLALFFLVATGTSSLCAAQDSWVGKSGMNQSRSDLGVAVADGKIYAIGGATSSGFCSFNEEYDPTIDSWTMKAPMPTGRSDFGIAAYQNKIYCIGGYCLFNNQGGATAVNEVYDPATDSWETKAPMPTPELDVRANVVEGKIYVIGGNNNGTLNQVYDPATDLWATKSPIPTAVESYASAVVGDKIYVFTNSLTQIYNAQNDSWSFGTPAPSPVILATADATTGMFAPARIYVFGVNAQLPYWQLTTKGFITQCYDPETGSWTASTSMPTGRYDVGVAVVDDLLYVIGGFTIQFSSTVVNPNPTYTYSALNQQYTPIDYGTAPLMITVLYPENTTYVSGNIPLSFTTNKPFNSAGYSLDGQQRVTITGNTTLISLSTGLHNITVYAKDSFGDMVSSQTITFRVAKPEVSQATTFTIIGSGASVAVVFVGRLLYLKKRCSH